MSGPPSPTESRTIHLHEQGADTTNPSIKTEVTVELESDDIDALRNLVNQDDEGDAIEFTRSLAAEEEFTIRAKQFVGSIGLPSGRVLRIHPKIDDQSLGRMLAYTGESRTRFPFDSTTLDKGHSFIDALAKQLASEISSVITQGMRRSYRQVTETRDSVRGRINVERQLQRQPPLPVKFECTYDQYTYDTIQNQTLLRASTIASNLTTSDSIWHDLRQLQTEFERRNVTRQFVAPPELDALTFSRLESHYEQAIALARIFITRDFITEADSNAVPVSSFLVEMNDLFERLVRRVARDLYEKRSPTYRVTKEPVGHFVSELPDNVGFGYRLPPDVVIKDAGKYTAVMDAKWTMEGPQMDHFYQMVAYMTVMRVDTGVLVYPNLDEPYQRFCTKAGKEVTAVELPLKGITSRSQYEFENTIRSEFKTRLSDAGVFSPDIKSTSN